MTMHIHSAHKRISKRLLILGAAFLLALPLSVADTGAEYLLQSARHFTPYHDLPFLRELTDVVVGDVTGDGIPDIVTGSTFGKSWGPIVFTLPGLGDGTYADAVFSESPLEGGIVNRMAMGLLNGDEHPDLAMTYQQIWSDDLGVVVLLGNGDGAFTMSDHLVTTYSAFGVVIADFDGDSIMDIAATLGSNPDDLVQILRGEGDGTFSEGGAFDAGIELYCLTTGDFDGDGDTDLAAGGDSNGDFAVLINDGTGSFSVTNHDMVDVIASIAAGDLNDDGFDDLLVGSTFGKYSLRLFLGSSSGITDPWVELDAGLGIFHVDLGDLDDDGDLDIVTNSGGTEDPGDNMVSVLLNNGDGTFAAPGYQFRSGGSITLHDMNGDTALDAVMVGPSEYFVSVLPGIGDGTFIAMTDMEISDYYGSGVHADIDGDGDMDLGVVDPGNDLDGAVIVRNNGDGTFADPERYEAGNNPWGLAFADLNGDRLPEMIIVNYDSDTDDGITVLMNAGDGTYVDSRRYIIGNNTYDVKAGDLDGDGDLDLAICHWGNLGVLINPGNGIFTEVVNYEGPLNPVDMALGDVNGDGFPDAVITGAGVIYLSINNGDGSFTSPRLIAEDNYTIIGLVLADVDGDGDLDLAAGFTWDSTIHVLLNDGAGNFVDTAESYPSGSGIYDLVAGDLDRDGHLDLVAANSSSEDVCFLPGFGDGSFGPPQAFPTGNHAVKLDLADFDSNGSLDVVACGPYGSIVSIFFNSLSSTGLLATGPGRGEFNPTLVRIFPAGGSGDPIAQWSAYGVDRWGVNMALGELTGSGLPEVVTGAGPGAVFGPHVRGFDINGTPLPGVSFLAYGTNKYGVNVACGDLDNDGYDEIVTGAGPGAVFGPHVRGWNWDGAGAPTPIPGISYFAYGTPKWGVNVSCGDIDGDGFDEIITGAGPGAVYGPHVRGWNCDGGGAMAIPGVSFLAYGTNKFGVNVCCGDIDGDGIDELVTGAGPGAVFGPHVRGWNWDGSGSTQAIPAVSFFAYQYPQWGANVSCGDLDDDGIDEIITGPGPGPDYLARVRGFNYDGQSLTAMGGVDFIAYEGAGNRYGVKVAGIR